MENSNSLIRKHESCIEILEAVKYFEGSVIRIEMWVNGFASTFPELRRKNLNKIEIYRMCIERLYQRYDKVFKTNNQ